MAAIVTNSSATMLYMAAEDATTGDQTIIEAAVTDLTAWTNVYSGPGTAANVAAVAANPDKMVFYGNFDTDIGVVSYEISTQTTTDISPASLGAAVVNTLLVNPSNEAEMICTVNTGQDVYHTDDGGATWTNLVDIGLNATALAVVWGDAYNPTHFLAGGDIAASEAIIYSPNAGESTDDVADAGIQARTAICAIEVIS